MIDCRMCKGTGKQKHWGDSNKTYFCNTCEGTGRFPSLDEQAKDLLGMLVKKGVWCKARPKCPPYKSNHATRTLCKRAYYVWSLARFRGGRAAVMPISAMIFCEFDPELERLDKLADMLAIRVFGTSTAAARRSITPPDSPVKMDKA